MASVPVPTVVTSRLEHCRGLCTPELSAASLQVGSGCRGVFNEQLKGHQAFQPLVAETRPCPSWSYRLSHALLALPSTGASLGRCPHPSAPGDTVRADQEPHGLYPWVQVPVHPQGHHHPEHSLLLEHKLVESLSPDHTTSRRNASRRCEAAKNFLASLLGPPLRPQPQGTPRKPELCVQEECGAGPLALCARSFEIKEETPLNVTDFRSQLMVTH